MASQHSPDTLHDFDSAGDGIDRSYIGSREDTADSRTVASRKRLRDQLSSEIEAFLAQGGKIDQVDSRVSADPPRRPNNHYGQRPIS